MDRRKKKSLEISGNLYIDNNQFPLQHIDCVLTFYLIHARLIQHTHIHTRKDTQVKMSSYVGFANLPNQVHRKTVKRGFEFTLMVVGESGLGKSTLINSLFLTDLYSDRSVLSTKERIQSTLEIQKSSVEIEERGKIR